MLLAGGTLLSSAFFQPKEATLSESPLHTQNSIYTKTKITELVLSASNTWIHKSPR